MLHTLKYHIFLFFLILNTIKLHIIGRFGILECHAYTTKLQGVIEGAIGSY